MTDTTTYPDEDTTIYEGTTPAGHRYRWSADGDGGAVLQTPHRQGELGTVTRDGWAIWDSMCLVRDEHGPATVEALEQDRVDTEAIIDANRQA